MEQLLHKYTLNNELWTIYIAKAKSMISQEVIEEGVG